MLISDDSLGYWMAHELRHLAVDDVKEDAEKAPRNEAFEGRVVR
jgi:hypothetical protein